MAGDNLRLTDMQGAIGVAQMARLRGSDRGPIPLAMRYDELLAPLRVAPQRTWLAAAVQSYVALVSSGRAPAK